MITCKAARTSAELNAYSVGRGLQAESLLAIPLLLPGTHSAFRVNGREDLVRSGCALRAPRNKHFIEHTNNKTTNNNIKPKISKQLCSVLWGKTDSRNLRGRPAILRPTSAPSPAPPRPARAARAAGGSRA